MSTGPLNKQLKVIEYCSLAAGPFCTKLLADFDAEVIKIEQPGTGDEARRRGPFLNDNPDPELSGLFLYLNTNQLGITLDLETEDGREIFKRLIADADIFVEDKAPGEMKRLGLECRGDHFCMGTMFISRAKVLEPLQSPLISPETFQDTLNDREHDFKSAHYYERMISILPYSFGLTHLPISPRKRDELWIKSMRFAEKPFKWIFCVAKKGPEKRKFFRLFGFEFYLESSKK